MHKRGARLIYPFHVMEINLNEIPSSYGKFWRAIGSDVYETMFNNRPLLHNDFIKWLRNRKNVKTVLEVGCGTGVYPIKFKELFSGMEYMGIDFAESAIEFCKKRSKFNFTSGDFIKMNLDKKYDLVFSHAVIDHVYDINAFLKKIVSSCKKYAYISSYLGYFPNFEGHLMRWKDNTGSYDNKLSIKEIRSVLIDSGLEEQEFIIREQESGNLTDNIETETVIEICRHVH